MSKEGDYMAWQTPKTDWKAGDVPSAGDFNRIEGNIIELNNAKETIGIVQQNLNAHIADNIKHITSTERTKWNNKQDALPAERTRRITYGTSPPSGGNDGDIYIQYE